MAVPLPLSSPPPTASTITSLARSLRLVRFLLPTFSGNLTWPTAGAEECINGD
jgi:hypothetical protein